MTLGPGWQQWMVGMNRCSPCIFKNPWLNNNDSDVIFHDTESWSIPPQCSGCTGSHPEYLRILGCIIPPPPSFLKSGTGCPAMVVRMSGPYPVYLGIVGLLNNISPFIFFQLQVLIYDDTWACYGAAAWVSTVTGCEGNEMLSIGESAPLCVAWRSHWALGTGKINSNSSLN